MAKDIFRTPLAEVRWAHLITPRHQLDKSKPKAWTADLLLPNSDEKAQSFLLAMEDQFIALHGSRKRRAEKGFPWKPDKEKPSEITVVRFKVPQFQRRDGSLSEGPRIVPRQPPWPFRDNQVGRLGELDGRQVVAGDNLAAATDRRQRKLSHPQPEPHRAIGLF